MEATRDEKAASSTQRGVRLAPGGILVDGELVPLLAGTIHYWRLEPRSWRACLEATKALGVRLIDVYIPWGVHEIAPGQLELGQNDPQRDVAAFLKIAHELGLYVIARPGPHINAELTYFGLPERVVWDPSCQARSRSNSPVMLPMLPFAFPVPSYASDAFHDETARYYQTLAPALKPLLYPDGPIVLLQVDNEAALYFRDCAYDQDYHPDAIALYRAFVREKYRSIEALQAAYDKPPPPPHNEGQGDRDEAREGETRFASLMPPTRFDAETPADLARHIDWAEFQEHLLSVAIERFARSLASAGLSGVPTTHNLPMGHDATPLTAARLGRSIDLVGLDYYFRASPESRLAIARRTTELAVRCEGLGAPAFSCEMGAGFAPFFPPMEERDSAFTVLTALAYGLRGFNIYMAVERDRWIGAPIDRHGRARPFAAFWRKLTSALSATRFHELKRSVPVRLLIPRSERRLARAMHAFGPLTGAFFSIIGAGPRESSREDELGLGYPIAIEADTFARAFELALEARGVPFAHVGGEDRGTSLAGARWIICATSGGMNPELFERLAAAAGEGALITLGPREPVLDGAMRPLAGPLDVSRLKASHPGAPLVIHDDPKAAHAAVSRTIDALGLPTTECDPEGIYATVHEDAAGAPRVMFLLNPGASDVVARVTVAPTVTRATDVLDDITFEVRRLRQGALEVRMKPHTVRMLALE